MSDEVRKKMRTPPRALRLTSFCQTSAEEFAKFCSHVGLTSLME